MLQTCTATRERSDATMRRRGCGQSTLRVSAASATRFTGMVVGGSAGGAGAKDSLVDLGEFVGGPVPVVFEDHVVVTGLGVL